MNTITFVIPLDYSTLFKAISVLCFIVCIFFTIWLWLLGSSVQNPMILLCSETFIGLSMICIASYFMFSNHKILASFFFLWGLVCIWMSFKKGEMPPDDYEDEVDDEFDANEHVWEYYRHRNSLSKSEEL